MMTFLSYTFCVSLASLLNDLIYPPRGKAGDCLVPMKDQHVEVVVIYIKMREGNKGTELSLTKLLMCTNSRDLGLPGLVYGTAALTPSHVASLDDARHCSFQQPQKQNNNPAI